MRLTQLKCCTLVLLKIQTVTLNLVIFLNFSLLMPGEHFETCYNRLHIYSHTLTICNHIRMSLEIA